LKVAQVPLCTGANLMYPLAYVWREGLKGNRRFPLWIPPTRFDRVTPKLWAWALCRWVKGVKVSQVPWNSPLRHAGLIELKIYSDSCGIRTRGQHVPSDPFPITEGRG